MKQWPRQAISLQTLFGPDLVVRIEFYGTGDIDAAAFEALRQNIEIMERALTSGTDAPSEQELSHD